MSKNDFPWTPLSGHIAEKPIITVKFLVPPDAPIVGKPYWLWRLSLGRLVIGWKRRAT